MIKTTSQQLCFNRPHISVMDFAEFLANHIASASVDLLLTDPPYSISRPTGFKNIGKKGVPRFAVSMEFGDWDSKPIDLQLLANLGYRGLRNGGTAIVFYDVWKISHLAEAMTAAGFKQLRLIEWLKTNPVPLNAKRNYLSNAREIAVLGVKGGKPTFHSGYDNGIYHYPIPHGGPKARRLHPTQKPLGLMDDLVRKHSQPGDLIVDPFLGGGTTALAALNNKRRFAGCDKDAGYVAVATKRLAQAGV